MKNNRKYIRTQKSEIQKKVSKLIVITSLQTQFCYFAAFYIPPKNVSDESGPWVN